MIDFTQRTRNEYDRKGINYIKDVDNTQQIQALRYS